MYLSALFIVTYDDDGTTNQSTKTDEQGESFGSYTFNNDACFGTAEGLLLTCSYDYLKQVKSRDPRNTRRLLSEHI